MVQFNLDQYLAGSDLVTITSGDLAAHNPDQFEGTVNSLGITFEARLRTVSEKNLFAHFDYVKFASRGEQYLASHGQSHKKSKK